MHKTILLYTSIYYYFATGMEDGIRYLSKPYSISNSRSQKGKLWDIIQQDRVGEFRGQPSVHLSPNQWLGDYTILTFAIAAGAKQCAQSLITQWNADVNKLDKKKHSALVKALEHKEWALAQLLVDYGASVNLPQEGDGSWGLRSPLGIFLTRISGRSYIWESYIPQMRWLLEHNANPSSYCLNGVPLGYMAPYSHTKEGSHFIKLLCDHGADVNAYITDSHKTVLHWCAQRRHCVPFKYHLLTVFYLLQRGADINACDDNYVTPLHEAVFNNEEPDTPVRCGAERTNADLIAYLLYMGANPTLKNSRGQTPRDLARQPEVVAMLEHPKLVALPERVREILEPLRVNCEKIL